MTKDTKQQTLLPERKPLSFYKDSKGSWRTQSLFLEYKRSPYEALWTLSEEDVTDEDGTFYPSLRKIYLSYNHVPGYEHEFVDQQIGSYPFWLKLSSSSFIAKDIAEWRAELEVKIKSHALKNLVEQSRSVTGTSAAKYLAEAGWKAVSKRGRPSNEEKKKALLQDKHLEISLQEDLARIKGISIQ